MPLSDPEIHIAGDRDIPRFTLDGLARVDDIAVFIDDGQPGGAAIASFYRQPLMNYGADLGSLKRVGFWNSYHDRFSNLLIDYETLRAG